MTTIWWQKATETSVLLVQEDRSPKSGCGQGWFLPEAGRGNPFQGCVPAAASCQPSLACGCSPPILFPSGDPHPLCVSPFPVFPLQLVSGSFVNHTCRYCICNHVVTSEVLGGRDFWGTLFEALHRWPSRHSLLQLPLLQVSATPQGLLGFFLVPDVNRFWKDWEADGVSCHDEGVWPQERWNSPLCKVPAENASQERLRENPGLARRWNETERQSLALGEQGLCRIHLAWCWARKRHSPGVHCPTREAPANASVPSFTECVEHFGTKQRI